MEQSGRGTDGGRETNHLVALDDELFVSANRDVTQRGKPRCAGSALRGPEPSSSSAAPVVIRPARRWSVDWLPRYVSQLSFGPIPAYATSNARLAWQMTPRLEFAIGGQNLHQARHVEWANGAGANVEIQRSGYLKITWRR
jgi:hypothetical protein